MIKKLTELEIIVRWTDMITGTEDPHHGQSYTHTVE